MTVPFSVANGWWQKLADVCIAKVDLYANTVDPTLNKNGPVFAAMAQAMGEYTDWADSRLASWFDYAVAVRSPSGGYGVGASLDGLPVDTNFLITTACFVGPRLADGYDHGFVSQDDFDKILDCVRNWPAYAYNWGISGQPGALPDYSATPAGGTTAQHTEDRIWNVVAAAASFLLYQRDKHSIPAARTDCYNKGVAYKNGVVWAMNRPTNFGGWGYRGVNSSMRQDGSHNWLCADMSSWLPGGTAPLRTQMTAGIVAGDIAATTTGTAESNYLAGALPLMARHPEAFWPPSTPTGMTNYADQLIGRVAAQIDANTSTNPGGWASTAWNCLMVHRKGLTL